MTRIAADLSRRMFLQSAAVACAGSVLADDVRPGSGSKSGWIDAHSHIWTSDLSKYPLANGQRADDLQPRDFTDDQLIAQGQPHGVTRFVLIQHKPYHGLDNSYIVDAIAKRPKVFSGVACIEAASPRPQDEMDKLARQGIRGFRIRPGEGGAANWAESAGMNAMWRRAAETGLAMCPLINPENIPEVDAMCRRYPDAPVVVDHFARIGIDGTFHPEDVKALADLARHKRTHVKVSAFYALGKKQPPYDDLLPLVRRMYEAYGPDRLMWATDCPYQLGPGNSYGESVALIRDRADFLTDADREKLLRGTAERVFFGRMS
jgi:predicted TIM-barrel fold metal-dependent hydrolase